MIALRKTLFPYGMARNPDGSWTLFNRHYKPVGVVSRAWAEWNDARHKVRFKALRRPTLAKLDVDGCGGGERIYFYDDGCVPTLSAANMRAYLDKMAILMRLQTDDEPFGTY